MRELVLEGDPILGVRCKPFNFDNPQEDPVKLKKEMTESMVKYEGLGLSACQLGIDLKVFVMRFDNNVICCFNPRITYMSAETTYMREGCLSFPGLYFPLQRAKGINCTFATDDGEVHSASFVDISAKVFQHEYDHMLGKVYLDHASNYMVRNARRKQNLWNRKRKNNGSQSS